MSKLFRQFEKINPARDAAITGGIAGAVLAIDGMTVESFRIAYSDGVLAPVGSARVVLGAAFTNAAMLYNGMRSLTEPRMSYPTFLLCTAAAGITGVFWREALFIGAGAGISYLGTRMAQKSFPGAFKPENPSL